MKRQETPFRLHGAGGGKVRLAYGVVLASTFALLQPSPCFAQEYWEPVQPHQPTPGGANARTYLVPSLVPAPFRELPLGAQWLPPGCDPLPSPPSSVLFAARRDTAASTMSDFCSRAFGPRFGRTNSIESIWPEIFITSVHGGRGAQVGYIFPDPAEPGEYRHHPIDKRRVLRRLLDTPQHASSKFNYNFVCSSGRKGALGAPSLTDYLAVNTGVPQLGANAPASMSQVTMAPPPSDSVFAGRTCPDHTLSLRDGGRVTVRGPYVRGALEQGEIYVGPNAVSQYLRSRRLATLRKNGGPALMVALACDNPMDAVAARGEACRPYTKGADDRAMWLLGPVPAALDRLVNNPLVDAVMDPVACATNLIRFRIKEKSIAYTGSFQRPDGTPCWSFRYDHRTPWGFWGAEALPELLGK